MEEMSLNKEIKHEEVEAKGREIWRSDPIHLTGEYWETQKDVLEQIK